MPKAPKQPKVSNLSCGPMSASLIVQIKPFIKAPVKTEVGELVEHSLRAGYLVDITNQPYRIKNAVTEKYKSYKHKLEAIKAIRAAHPEDRSTEEFVNNVLMLYPKKISENTKQAIILYIVNKKTVSEVSQLTSIKQPNVSRALHQYDGILALAQKIDI